MNLLIIALLSTCIFCSCESITGSGNIVSESRNLKEFTGIKNSGSIDVEVIHEERQMVKVVADDNILEYVITKVENGVLNIYLKNNLSFRSINVTVYVSSPSIQQLLVSGSGTITSKNLLKDEDKIELKVSGSGEIEANLDAPSIVANVSGSGKILLRGRTKNFSSTVSGSGDLDCEKLLAENTAVKVSGSGNANVFASVNLDAKVSGSGNIFYSGNPTSPQIHKSGSGSIQAQK
jgi:hypothetical protein